MNLLVIKDFIINSRELVVQVANAIYKFLPVFPAENLAGLLVLVLSFLIAHYLVNFFPKLEYSLLIKLLGTAALFYVLWLW